VVLRTFQQLIQAIPILKCWHCSNLCCTHLSSIITISSSLAITLKSRRTPRSATLNANLIKLSRSFEPEPDFPSQQTQPIFHSTAITPHCPDNTGNIDVNNNGTLNFLCVLRQPYYSLKWVQAAKKLPSGVSCRRFFFTRNCGDTFLYSLLT
jgi:hypothetical protein